MSSRKKEIQLKYDLENNVNLIKFSEDNADQVVWGSGDHYGTMTYRCKSIDHGFIPLLMVVYILVVGRLR